MTGHTQKTPKSERFLLESAHMCRIMIHDMIDIPIEEQVNVFKW